MNGYFSYPQGVAGPYYGPAPSQYQPPIQSPIQPQQQRLQALEQQYPALRGNSLFQSLKGKTPSEIEQYAGNLAGTLGIFK